MTVFSSAVTENTGHVLRGNMATSDDITRVIQALEERIAVLESELSAVRRDRFGDSRARVEDADGGTPSPVANRRDVLRLAAATAVGAAAATVVMGNGAAAADGDPLVLGSGANSATMATHLKSARTALVLESTDDYGLVCDGGRGNAMFLASGNPPSGGPGAGEVGALRVDGQGNWWAATTTSPTDGAWRVLAGPTTAGSLHLLNAPTRIYDSRETESNDARGDPMRPLVAKVARTIELYFRPITAPLAPPGLWVGTPPSARGALITLTITNPSAAGFASVWPSGAWPGTSNVNFSTGQTIATTTTVALALSDRGGAAFQTLSNVSTDVVIDYIGYYL